MRIWIMWTYSSWKTTLANRLVSELPWHILDINQEREVANKVWFDFNNYTDEELLNYQTSLLWHLASVHMNLYNIITDTPIPLIAAYTQHPWLIDTVKYYKKYYDLIVYCNPDDCKLEDDWVRHQDEKFRKEVDKKIQEIIKDMNVVKVYWPTYKRVKQVLDYINKLWLR